MRLKSEQDSEAIAGTQEEGQVELCLGGVWSKLCAHSGWGTQEASVVCRQTLGPGNAVGKLEDVCTKLAHLLHLYLHLYILCFILYCG